MRKILSVALLRAIGATIIAALFLLMLKFVLGRPAVLDIDDWAESLPVVFIATFLASLPNNHERT